MISCDAVSKKYGETYVVKDVTVSFTENRIHGLIGRNGSGKSVLLKCICGLIGVSAGRIIYDGKVMRKDINILPSLGAIIEEPGFLPHYSGYANLKKLGSIKGIVDNAAIIESMARVGLDSKSKKWVAKYSTGMRQRLGIAQAIMENPSVLILDEPMNGLDHAGVIEMRKLFNDLRAPGRIIILTSHNREDISELCDTVHEMDAGKITLVSG